MDELALVTPTKDLEISALDYKREHFDHQEYELHGGALLDQTKSYDAWIKQLRDNTDAATVHTGWVVSSTFFAMRKSDDRIVGMIDIRHSLNDFLRSYGGHIGYGVRPSERNKGYAAQMLQMGLAYCRKLGLQKVMLACYKENGASSKTITKCGGLLEKEFLHSDGKMVQVFWITL